jgi:hypothetical protein
MAEIFSSYLSTKASHHLRQLNLESSKAKYGGVGVTLKEVIVCECHGISVISCLIVSVSRLQEGRNNELTL